MSDAPVKKYVTQLPDLITRDDYKEADQRKLVRLQLRMTDQGLEIIGDSQHPHLLDELLESLDPEAIEAMLCG